MRPDRDPEARPAEPAPQPHAGRSACAAEARRQETARLLAMSSLERALLALSLGARLDAFARSRPR